MAKKLTTVIATQMVDRIEALQDQIDLIYREANLEYAGNANSNVIRDAWKNRQALREAQYNDSALLASLDAEDE